MIDVLIMKLKEAKTPEQMLEVKLDTIKLISDLGHQYASHLQNFSASIIMNKEEWFKKSMIECIHQAGREVGYLHESTKTDIEAAKALLQVICDMEKVETGLQSGLVSGQTPTVHASTLGQAVSPEPEGTSNFDKTPDTADE